MKKTIPEPPVPEPPAPPTDAELIDLATQLAERMPTVETLQLVMANLQASLRLADQLEDLQTANVEAARAVLTFLENRQREKAEWRRACAQLQATCAQLAATLTIVAESEGAT